MNLPNATRESATNVLRSLRSKTINLERDILTDKLTADQLIDKSEALVGLTILLEREARTTKIAQDLLRTHGASTN